MLSTGFLNHSGCSAHVLENQSHSSAWQKQVSSTRRDTNMHGRRLFVTNWIIPWDVWCISKDLPDRGITSTACLVLSSIDCTPLSSTTKARSKSQPKIQKVCKWIWTPTFFCSSKSPSQQECLVSLTLLGWLGCYEPIAPVFPIWKPKLYHQHLSCKAHDFLLRKNKKEDCFLGLEKYFSLMDGVFFWN